MGLEGKLLISRKIIVVNKESISIDQDLTKRQKFEHIRNVSQAEKGATQGSRTEKQKIVCMRVIALLAMVSDRDHEPGKTARFCSSLSNYKGHVRRTDSVYWFLGKQSIP